MNTYHYSYLQFIPRIGGVEAVTLGVIVVDDTSREATNRLLPSFTSKVRALAPTYNIAILEHAARRLGDRASTAHQASLEVPDDVRIRSSEQLRVLAAAMQNQLQLTSPRPYRAMTLAAAADWLYEQYVKPVTDREPEQTPGPQPMPLDELRRLIRSTISHWGKAAIANDNSEPAQVLIEERVLERGGTTRHFADFWLKMGDPFAALVAIPSDPKERDQAWARRDALPTIAKEFTARCPQFKAVAVFPPDGGRPSQFMLETEALFGNEAHVLVLRADELEARRSELTPALV